MSRSLAVQLTTRCNLACAHCFVEKREEDLPLESVRRVADFARDEGYREIELTGGEPLLHPELPAVLGLLEERDLSYTLVSNGWSLDRVLALAEGGARAPSWVSLSLDGSDAETHDLNRGEGSFRRVLEASESCRRRGLPFGFRTSLLPGNVDRIEELVALSAERGAGELALMPLIPTPGSVRAGRLLSPGRLLRLPAEVARLQEATPVRLVLTAGHFSWEILEPCPALAGRSLFLTARGELGLCCHLAGHEAAGKGEELVARLDETGLHEAAAGLETLVSELRALKLARREAGELGPLDHFPCWFCLKHFGKVDWMRSFPGDAWSGDLARVRAS